MARTQSRQLGAWFRATWEFDPLLAIVSPLILAFYLAVAFGPPIAVFLVDRPSMLIGVPAALMAFGVVARMFVEGFWARRLAVASRDLGGDVDLHTRSWAIVLRAVIAIAWLIPVIGLWSAALENRLDPTTAGLSLDYTWLSLWEVANVIPFLEIPRTLGFPAPPISSWTLGTGVALIALKLVVVYSVIIVIVELVPRRGFRDEGLRARGAR